jgi:hypothetical protein
MLEFFVLRMFEGVVAKTDVGFHGSCPFLSSLTEQ